MRRSEERVLLFIATACETARERIKWVRYMQERGHPYDDIDVLRASYIKRKRKIKGGVSQ